MKNVKHHVWTFILTLFLGIQINYAQVSTYQDHKWMNNGSMNAQKTAINANSKIFFTGKMEKIWRDWDIELREKPGFHISRTNLDGSQVKTQLFNLSDYDLWVESMETLDSDENDLIHASNISGLPNSAALYNTEGIVSRVNNSNIEMLWSRIPQHIANTNGGQTRKRGTLNYAGTGHGGRIIAAGSEPMEETIVLEFWDEESQSSVTLYNTINIDYTSIFEIDANGNQIHKSALIDPQDSLDVEVVKILPINEEDYLMLSAINNYYGQGIDIGGFEITYLDKNLNVVWTKRMLDTWVNHLPVDLLIDYDNEQFYVLAKQQENDKIRHYGIPAIFSFDLSGKHKAMNVYNPKPFVDSKNQKPVALQRIGTKLYIAGHTFHNSFFHGNNINSYLIHIDITGNSPMSANKVTYYGTEQTNEWFYDLEVHNNQLFAAGEVNAALDHSADAKSFLVLMDNNGDVWCEYFGNEVAHSMIIEELQERELYADHPENRLLEIEFSREEINLNFSRCAYGFWPEGDFGLFKAESTEKKAAEVFPNPSNGRFTVKLGRNFNLDKPVNATLLNISGQIIKQVQINQPSTDFELSQLDAGMYILRLAQDQHSEQQKLIIKK